MASESDEPPPPPTSINEGEYKVVKRIGAGAFGEVWLGKNAKEDEVAMKFEYRGWDGKPQLFREAELIKSFWRDSTSRPDGLQGIVECFYFGREGAFNCMVMDILGKSLEDLVKESAGKFTPKTAGLIAEQVLQRIEYFHSKKVLHRDIKAENFMCGIKGKMHHIYIIDFGFLQRYWDAKTNAHVPEDKGLTLTGTARFASINAHKGLEQSRRDDLEAIGHMFFYFLLGVLPWSGLPEEKSQEEKYQKICEKKESTPIADLCKGSPGQYEEYLRYCRGLGYSTKPDYTKLYEMFRATRTEGTEDHSFEWLEGEGEFPTHPRVPLNPRKSEPMPDDKSSQSSSKKAGDAAGGASKGGASKGCCSIT